MRVIQHGVLFVLPILLIGVLCTNAAGHRWPSCADIPWCFTGGTSGYLGGNFTDSDALSAIDRGISFWTGHCPIEIDAYPGIYGQTCNINTFRWYYTTSWPGSPTGIGYYEVGTDANDFVTDFQIYFRGQWTDVTYVPWGVNCASGKYDVCAAAAHEFGHTMVGDGHYGTGIMEGTISLGECYSSLPSSDQSKLMEVYGVCSEMSMYNYDFWYEPWRAVFTLELETYLQNSFVDMEIEWNVSGMYSQVRRLTLDEWSELKTFGSTIMELNLMECPPHEFLNISITPNLTCEYDPNNSGTTYDYRRLCVGGTNCAIAVGCEIINFIAYSNSSGGVKLEWDAKSFDAGIEFNLYGSIDGGIAYPELIETFVNPDGGGTFHFEYVDNGAIYNFPYCYRIRDSEVYNNWGPVHAVPGGNLGAPPYPESGYVDFEVEYIDDGKVKIEIVDGLQWSARYELHYSRDVNGPPYEHVITSNNYLRYIIVNGLDNGYDYFFNCIGCNLVGCSDLHALNAKRAIPTPTPQNVVVTPLYEALRVAWDASPGASGYVVHYNHILFDPPGLEEYEVNAGDTTLYTIENIENASQYQLFMSAYDIWGNQTPVTDIMTVRSPGDVAYIDFINGNQQKLFTCLLGDVLDDTPPAGLPDSLSVSAVIKDGYDNIIRQLPAELMYLVLDHKNIHSCLGDTIQATFPTDDNGIVEFSIKHIGGSDDSLYARLLVDGFMSANSVSFIIMSTDLNGDGIINLSDLCIWGLGYPSRLGDENYDPLLDYTCDDRINLSDFIFFANHYHVEQGCP